MRAKVYFNKKHIRRHLRKEQTEAEKKLWKMLRNRNFKNLKFRRQHSLKDYIVDFFCFEKALIIELNGSHHSTLAQREKDRLRDIHLKHLGYTILRFKNKTVFENTGKILNEISKAPFKNEKTVSKLPRGKPTRHSLETNFQFRGKPRGIKPFGGANKAVQKKAPHPGLLPNGRRSYSVLSTKMLSTSQKNLLLNSGLQLVEYNAIKIEFLDFNFPQAVLENAIITSKNSVKAVLKKKIRIKNCYCVGEKTATFLQENGYFVKKTANYGKELGKIINEKYSDEKFTFFCGNKRRPELPSILKENKIDFKEIEVYKTSLNSQKFNQQFDGILFFSPSAVKSFSEKNNLEGIPAFCIGKTTAIEAQKHTQKIIIATKPSIENVLVQVVKYFNF